MVGIDPKTYRYASRRPDDAVVRARLRDELGECAPAIGYRRLHILLKREGIELNLKKLFRLYREERLTVRRPADDQVADLEQASDLKSELDEAHNQAKELQTKERAIREWRSLPRS